MIQLVSFGTSKHCPCYNYVKCSLLRDPGSEIMSMSVGITKVCLKIYDISPISWNEVVLRLHYTSLIGFLCSDRTVLSEYTQPTKTSGSVAIELIYVYTHPGTKFHIAKNWPSISSVSKGAENFGGYFGWAEINLKAVVVRPHPPWSHNQRVPATASRQVDLVDIAW